MRARGPSSTLRGGTPQEEGQSEGTRDRSPEEGTQEKRQGQVE